MTAIIQANKLNMIDVEHKFSLNQTDDIQFFREWFDGLPEITDIEKQVLDRAKANYLNAIKHREISENLVKMTVIAPLLAWANFYQLPFDIVDENSIDISVETQNEIIKGRIDIIVFKHHLWLLVIESKNAGLSIINGIPQGLTYMMANPHPEQPIFGLVTNGDDFQFIKLVKQNSPQYALSKKFTISNPQNNELYHVLSILKKLGQVIN
ncbi:MAG: restriction endonuclease subunit R [Okeania sp. SIO2C9]|uniref:type I restriction enzyme HsdR N-terminal domain-containing protein n=1 Tax=Okeania sp. SIO2C9 TaxID=2607791 RepID=UPI0013C0C689|nr:type I restriction enzyme HsdR N-terminal domain-containing protein [Okeania sp. SIO2C9]NEQ76812.1 restriction endonuclease subunit R [Okeania sp. SIO2C9]